MTAIDEVYGQFRVAGWTYLRGQQMKIACVTTTIRVPRVLALYAKHDPDVFFIVIGDRKTDDLAVVDFLTDACPNHAYYGIDRQHAMYPELSPLLGENCIQRRNIGFLEALSWGADVIVSIDDDNIPLRSEWNYFEQVSSLLGWSINSKLPIASFEYANSWEGLKGVSSSGWFDVGTLLQPAAEHRGFPHTKRAQPAFESVIDAKLGVAAGICLGDPDISAVERIANGPIVHGVSEILRSGVVVDPRGTWTVFNSQNTAIVRELVPAWFMFPGVGRFDDLYASLVVQAVARKKGLHVHFGRPFVFQQRNSHDLIKDLRQEIDGMENIVHLAGILDQGIRFAADEHPARTIYKKLAEIGWFPKRASEAALSWMDDVEKVL